MHNPQRREKILNQENENFELEWEGGGSYMMQISYDKCLMSIREITT